jgi:hypothetical protein
MALAARVWPADRLESLYEEAQFPERLDSLEGWGSAD